MSVWQKRIEIVANVAIILVATLIAVTLVRGYMLSGAVSADKSDQRGPSGPQVGTKVALPSTDWAKNKRTILLVLSERCRYCTESADFYQKLLTENERKGDARVIALLPQDVATGQSYLKKLGVPVDEVQEVPPSAVGASATPTVMIVDGEGLITDYWVGKLPPEKEAEVMARL